MTSADTQPHVDAETELATYLGGQTVKYAKLVFDEAKGFQVRKHASQNGMLADALEWWKVGSSSFSGLFTFI